MSRALFLGLAVGALCRLALAATPEANNGTCQCVGVDYSDEGSYFIDATEHGDFAFTSEFEGNCSDLTITPVLQDGQQHQYKCSPIRTSLIGVQQVSTCNIEYSSMTSGLWKILMATPMNEWNHTRSFRLRADGGAVTVTTTITAATTVTAVAESLQTGPPAVTDTVTSLNSSTFSTVSGTAPAGNGSSAVDSVTTTLSTTVTPSTTIISTPSSNNSVPTPPPTVSSGVTTLPSPTTIVPELTTTIVATITPVVVRTSTTPTFITVTTTNTRLQVTTLGTVTLTSTCRAIQTKTVTSTAAPTTVTSYSTVVKTATDSIVTSSFSTTKVVTASCIFASTPIQPTAVATFTVAGSACVAVNPFPAASPGDPRAPPWGYYGPPPWITSAWAANGLLPRCTSTPTKAATTTSRRTRREEMVANSPRAVDAAGQVQAQTTATFTETTYTATQWATQFAPSLTLTRLAVQTVVQTITPPAKVFCAEVPDVTQVVSVAGPRRIWVTIVTTTTHATATVSVTSTSYSIYDDIAAATSCWQSGGQFGVS